MKTSWPDLLTALVAHEDLSVEQAAWAMDQVMTGSVSPIRLASFLVGLRVKGETVEELTGLAQSMTAHAVEFENAGRAVDIVGTGGDRANTVNISTMASIIIAATGLPVIKHGNRAASSSSGSADVLEVLGIRLDHSPERVRAILDEAGITFCYAQTFHPSMRHAGAARREMGIATAFNFLGPLTNPARPSATAVGCADLRMAPLMAGVFAVRGTNALVFRGDDGLDELAATGTTQVWEVRDGSVEHRELDLVADLGMARITVDQLRGADAQFNAGVARQLFGGERGAVRETVLINAAAALVADGSHPGTGVGDLPQRLLAGYARAQEALDDGSAQRTLERWAQASAR